jgi:hypothetical protein
MWQNEEGEKSAIKFWKRNFGKPELSAKADSRSETGRSFVIARLSVNTQWQYAFDDDILSRW